jgi:xanthine dehydrogenase accessory factor
MRDIAKPVQALLSSGTDAWVVRVVSMEGFGGRRSGEVLLVPDTGPKVGGLLFGSADQAIDAAIAACNDAATTVRVPIGDTEAVASGLACGGTAELLIQRIGSIPEPTWDAIEARRPVLVASLVAPIVDDDTGNDTGNHTGNGIGSGATLTAALDGLRFGTLGDSAADDLAIVSAHQALVRKGGSSLSVETSIGRVFVEFVAPQPAIVVLGDVALAQAIAAQGSLLGWDVSVYDERTSGETERAATAVGSMGPVDGVVVLSHDIAASCSLLAAGLTGGCGYVGALGSRHTQGARADHLRTLGISDVLIGEICGPVGLDLGARTPEETALAIFAEALSVQRSKTASSLRSSSGAING